MALKGDNPVVGGTVLRRAAIQSPNYVPGVSGWTIKQDGSAEFNNLTIRGTFAGTNFVINAAGLFFYSPSEAAGNLVASIANTAGTDPFGNAYQAGLTTYSGSAFGQLLSGILNFFASGGQFSPGVVGTFGVAGQCGISSGEATNVDSPSNVIALSQVASGISGGEISLQAGQVIVTGILSVNGSTSTGSGDNGGVTSGPSGTVNSFPAAGPNHTHAEFHHHPL